MYEVEAKVPITRGEYSALRARLRKEGKYLGKKRSEDTYYNGPTEETVRIRKRGAKQSFDIKYRNTVKSIEQNIELEWDIKNLSTWQSLLKKLNIKPRIKKTKKTELYKYKGFHVELNEVRPLGYYLEIEKVIKDETKASSAKKDLIKVFKDLGYRQSDFEPKRYLELLANV